jgi:hypothetical protein
MIFAKERNPRLVTARRGGTLTDGDHHLLALWAADCAEHVLHFFEEAVPGDDRPRQAIAAIRAWTRGETTWQEARIAAFAANAVGHVAEHELGAAAYAIRAARAAASEDGQAEARRAERDWHRALLPEPIRQLVLEDQARRNEACWDAFSD